MVSLRLSIVFYCYILVDMDPTAILKIIYETARVIQETVKDVKANQEPVPTTWRKD